MHEELQDKIFVFGYEQYVNEVHVLYDVLWYKMILFANKQKWNDKYMDGNAESDLG